MGLAAADFGVRSWGIIFLETHLGRLPFWFVIVFNLMRFAREKQDHFALRSLQIPVVAARSHDEVVREVRP